MPWWQLRRVVLTMKSTDDKSWGRVLLVDDDPDVVWGIGRYLTRRGFEITTCGDGTEAVELLSEQDFEVVVTDIQMPGLNGLALIEWINGNRPDVRVVVMTAFGSPTVRELVSRKGAVLYLEKPVDPDLLVQVIENREPRESFSGVVDDIDLFDYVQLLMVTNRRALLEVVSTEGGRGRLFIEGGQVRHAECGEEQGEAAFYRCLQFDGGRFASVPWRDPPCDSISRRGDHLLMDAARYKDESAQGGASRPPSLVPPSGLDLDGLDLDWKL